MNRHLKKRGREWLPPILLQTFLGRRGGSWSGNFGTWADARKISTGYNSRQIISRVRDSLLKVKHGEAAYERDAVIFDEIQYSWPLLAGLMWIAAQSSGRLNLIDFGGSLGSTYFQNRKFLTALPALRWHIVEQPHFVEAGRKSFQDDHLKFYAEIDTCVAENSPDAILFSSVLQYLEAPYRLLEKVRGIGFEFILFDRTSFVLRGPDRLTVQRVPPAIYRASYPCWFFNRKRFLALFENDYEMIAEFDALAGEMRIDHRPAGIDKGFILRKRRRGTENGSDR